MTQEEILENLTDAVLEGDDEAVTALCQQALAEGLEPMVAIREGMAPGARGAGEKFNRGEYFLPQLVMAGEAMRAGLEVLLPRITAEAREEASGKIVIGSVEGDVHDIGKNIVSAMLTASGFDVLDLGVDVSPTEFVAKVKSEAPHIVGLGSYMSTTLPTMQTVIEELEEAGLRDKVKVMIGGVAASEEYARRIGADGFAADAPGAVKLAEQLVGGA